MFSRRTLLGSLLAGTSAVSFGCVAPGGGVKIGFVVKQPEDPWFQTEWRFAERAAADLGFELLAIGATDGEKVLAAIDSLGARAAQGLVICAPDTRLGVAIQQRAAANELKLMSVDDQLLGADGRPIEEIPHVGISAFEIGEQVGEVLSAEALRRGWMLNEVGLLCVTFDSLETARQRTSGAKAAFARSELSASQIFDAPMRSSDTEGGFNAASTVLTRQGELRRWVIAGMNDETVLGAVRAAEGAGLAVEDVIAVGINGSEGAIGEFEKAQATAFFATILLDARKHGYDTASAMYRWVADGVAPEPLTYTSGRVMTRENWSALRAEQDG